MFPQAVNYFKACSYQNVLLMLKWSIVIHVLAAVDAYILTDAQFIHGSTCCLTLTMLNFLIGIIHLTFLALSIIILRDIKMKTWKLVSQQMCRLA